MSATAGPRGRTATTIEPFYYEVVSADGTRLEAWTNDPDCLLAGPTVLLCNGLGTGPWTWPAFLRSDCEVRVISWNHRGIGGSERPADRNRIGVDEFVEDAVAVLDAAGADRVPVVGWSIGVNTMFELARRHPSRVSGLFAVAGVPGGTFATMLAPTRLPRFLRQAITVNLSRTMRYAGVLLNPIAHRLHVGRRTTAVVSHSGFMLPVADPEMTARAVQEFLAIPLDWYFHMALRTHQHQRVSLSGIKVPAVFIAAKYDLLAGSKDMLSAAERLSESTYVELRGSHFIQMEKPGLVHDELMDFLERLP